PEDSNSDLSLRAIDGAIETRLPLKMFGRTDGHALDARIGRGGSTVIARTSRASIRVIPDAASRMASLSKGVDTVVEPKTVSRGTNGTGSQTNSSSSIDGIRLGEDVLKLEARLVNLNVHITDVNGKTLP